MAIIFLGISHNNVGNVFFAFILVAFFGFQKFPNPVFARPWLESLSMNNGRSVSLTAVNTVQLKIALNSFDWKEVIL